MTQSSYVDKVLARFGMTNSKIRRIPLPSGNEFKKLAFPSTDERNDHPYRELIGCLLYLAVCTRPDISLAVAELARFVSNPQECHWHALTGLLQYVKGTREFGLYYGVDDGKAHRLHVYVDASWADCLQTRKSTTGMLTYVGAHLLDWSSKRQSIITHSTAEAEYVAADSATRVIIWFRALLEDLGEKQVRPTLIHEDNTACLVLARGEGKFLTSKHIGLRYHYLREKVASQEIELAYISTDKQLADLLTKPLAFARFDKLMKQVVFNQFFM